MLAEAKLTKQSISDVIVIPYRAVLSRDGINVVFVVEDGKAYEREVTTGIDNGEYIAVVEGLETGEKVVVSGQEFLADGTAVQVGGSTQ
jgi:multidrug efflux pump subunit AcrA (membrane-fusion protein)